ncbi:MAG: threonine/serine dehydratase [marine benthic group bacterium]|nr:threonine/serine dehydratase [Gemmatimonadota bacterium]
MNPSLVGLDEIRAAAVRIRGVARRTPLLDAPLASGRVWLKAESLQRVGAFKLRGAYNFLASCEPSALSGGVVTYSSGNHAQAVAWSARAFGVPATVVMPTDAPPVKREATIGYGARVEEVGTTTVERRARAEELLSERGGVMVPPFDHPAIIAGQGTAGLEIHDQMGEERIRRADSGSAVGSLSLLLVPIGGGGLLAGVAAAIRALSPETRIIGVEPEGAPKMRRSLEAGAPVTLDQVSTIADGLKPVRPGDLTFEHVRQLVDDVVLVDDDSIRRAVLWCYDRRLVVEPSGAATVAALLSGLVTPAPAGETCALLSGGNLDPQLMATWLEQAS